jgi:signal peptidase I
MHPSRDPDPMAEHSSGEVEEASSLSWMRTVRLFLREIVLETIAPAFVIALLINLFLVQSTYVHGQSMEPSLHSAQRLIVEKVSYKLHTPRRGDIVVVDVEGYDIPLIKRVIGLPGEAVEVRDNHVYIDGQMLDERYLADVIQRDYGPLQVAPGYVFVMGDNRGASNDSRYFGPVPIERILGRAWLSYWPPPDIQWLQ